ncbi:hypothetical protein Pfo_004489 [Paulownia fortunei]|nr:hypothetical protein Pfo_004489 [Paulownia fortunei]
MDDLWLQLSAAAPCGGVSENIQFHLEKLLASEQMSINCKTSILKEMNNSEGSMHSGKITEILVINFGVCVFEIMLALAKWAVAMEVQLLAMWESCQVLITRIQLLLILQMPYSPVLHPPPSQRKRRGGRSRRSVAVMEEEEGGERQEGCDGGGG